MKRGYLRHFEIFEAIDSLETERGRKVAGHRGYYLKNDGLLLSLAMQQLGVIICIKKDIHQFNHHTL